MQIKCNKVKINAMCKFVFTVITFVERITKNVSSKTQQISDGLKKYTR